MSKKGRIFSDEHKQNMSDAAKGKAKSKEHAENISKGLFDYWAEKSTKMKKSCSINGIHYNSVREAAKALDLKPSYIMFRCQDKKDKYKDWSYIDTPNV